METYEKKFYTVDGQQIHTVEAGRAGRQIAILIHGWSSSWYAVSPLMGLLAQRFHVMAIDLPGYGQSPAFPERTTIPKYAELLADFIEQVSDGPVVLVGHSMGGMIGLTLALKYPVLVERMVLLSPTISGRLSNFINTLIYPITLLERFGLGSVLVTSVERTVVGLTDRLMRPISFAERSDIHSQDYEQLRQDARRPGQGRVRAECFQAMLENDLSGRLQQLETPALIIWGAEDNTVPLRDAGVVADEYKTADLRIIPKAGHWAQFETPDVTRRYIAAYLGLPHASTQLYTPVEEEELTQIQEAAQFLAHSDLGNELNLAQRIRLAAQCQRKVYAAGQNIVHAEEAGQDLYIIESGSLEVWKDPDGLDPTAHSARMQQVATFSSGRIVGELSMLDGGSRSADLIAGPDGVTVLTLNRQRLLTLCEDDAVLGTRLLWNIATTVSRRVRFILWQLNRAEAKRTAAEQRPLGERRVVEEQKTAVLEAIPQRQRPTA